MKTKNIYCDGSCRFVGLPNAVAGWAYIVTEQSKIIHKEFGKLRCGTQDNNRAELEAMVQTLLYVDNNKDCKFEIFCDSEIVVNGIIGVGKREANRDIWEQIEKLCTRNLGRINVFHIGSHNYLTNDPNHKFNNMVDKLAKQGANSLLIAPTKTNI